MPPLLLLCLHNNKLRTIKEEDQENQLTLLLKFRLRKCLMNCAQGQKFKKQFYLYKLALFKLFLTSLSSPPAFSGDPYILQSHENDFIPIQEVEQEEPAELFRLNNWTFPL